MEASDWPLSSDQNQTVPPREPGLCLFPAPGTTNTCLRQKNHGCSQVPFGVTYYLHHGFRWGVERLRLIGLVGRLHP
jgi:hypothetical protein